MTAEYCYCIDFFCVSLFFCQETLIKVEACIEYEPINGNLSCCFVTLQGSNVVEDQDLLEIGILNSAHRQRLLQAIRLLPRVSTFIKYELYDLCLL